MIDWSLNLFSCVWRIKATPGKKILASFRCSKIGNYESYFSTSFPASLTWPPALTAARTTSPSPLETLLRWKKTLQQLGNRKRKTGRHFHPVLRQVASRLHRVLGRAAGDRVPHQPGLRQTFLFWANFVFFFAEFPTWNVTSLSCEGSKISKDVTLLVLLTKYKFQGWYLHSEVVIIILS